MLPPAVRGFPERLRWIWGGAAAGGGEDAQVISLGFLFRALRVTGTPKPAQIFDTDFLLQGHHDWVGSGHPQLMQGFGKKCRGLVTWRVLPFRGGKMPILHPPAPQLNVSPNEF